VSSDRRLVLERTITGAISFNGDGRVAKVDTDSGRAVARVATGRAPRSMTIAADGRSLYVVNYESDTVTKLRADDLTVLQSVPTNASPIGITYEPTRDQLWIACYTGSIQIFSDT
jgi:YVTN family beta-propeller protein